MKDQQFASDITELYSFAQKEPERLNARLNLKLHDCSRDEMWVEFLFESGEWCLPTMVNMPASWLA